MAGKRTNSGGSKSASGSRSRKSAPPSPPVRTRYPADRFEPRAYEAGRHTRRDPGWLPQGFGPNLEAESGGLELVRRRSRDVVDNNPLMAGAVETEQDNTVGCGIGWKWDTGFPDLNKRLQEKLVEYSERVDPERQLPRWESQRLFASEVFSAGDVIVYFPYSEAFNGYPAGPTIELIEAERLPLDLTGIFRPTGNVVRQGVEYDARGRTVAYHVVSEHPRDGSVGGYTLGSENVTRLPVGLCDLAFRSRRIAQLRGVPRVTAAIETLRMESGLCDDVMTSARMKANLSVVIPIEGNLSLFKQKREGKMCDVPLVDVYGNPVEIMKPGSYTFAPKGAEPKVLESQIVGPGFKDAESNLLRRAARPIGHGFTKFSGDMTGTNFSAQRQEELGDRRGFRPRQKFIFEHHDRSFIRRCCDWWMLTGEITLKDDELAAFKANPRMIYKGWPQYPGFEYVNPAQEAMADDVAIANGTRSEIDTIEESGRDFETVIRRRAEYAKREQEIFEEMGVPAPPRGGGGGGLQQTRPAGGNDAGKPADQQDDPNAPPPDDEGQRTDAMVSSWYGARWTPRIAASTRVTKPAKKNRRKDHAA